MPIRRSSAGLRRMSRIAGSSIFESSSIIDCIPRAGSTAIRWPIVMKNSGIDGDGDAGARRGEA